MFDSAQIVDAARATLIRSGHLSRFRGDLLRKEIQMNWDRINGNWKQITGKAKEQWGKLTDDDLEVVAGHRDQLARWHAWPRSARLGTSMTS
jgi:hypothetical protein